MKNTIEKGLNICAPHDPITVHCTVYRAGIGPEKGIFLGKDDSCESSEAI